MSFKIGIVGLPNAGKSTLFKALTKKSVDIANYPFCTIDPNFGVVKVPDERLDKLAAILKPEKILPTTIEFIDIAGLIKGAHKGEGLGNQFLSHIREVDAICHIVRSFEDKNVSHPMGKIEPEEDIKVINLELIMADLQIVDKQLEKAKPRARTGDKEQIKIVEILEKLKNALDNGQPASALTFTTEERELIRELHLLTIKPVLYVINVNNGKTPPAPNLRDFSSCITINAQQEAEMADLAEEEIKELGLEQTGLDKLIRASYELLNLITFFTCQNKILQAWTIKKDTKAPQAAGKIHTDFEKNFIKAGVINWKEFAEYGSELKAREKGLMRIEGKEYLVQEGDVIHFKTASPS